MGKIVGKMTLENLMRFKLFCFIMILTGIITNTISQELVYAEMEYPLSFISHLTNYRFNPLAKFQTEIEGRLIELTADPLVDIYEISSGRQAYRACLGDWRIVNLSDKNVLNFNLEQVSWSDNRAVDVDDVLFSLAYRQENKNSWESNQNIIIKSKGQLSFDAYLKDNLKEVPKPGEFYFPIVNKDVFKNRQDPSQAKVNKSKQQNIGYGRYYIDDIQENRYIRLKRREGHPYFKNLKIPAGYKPVNTILMQAFPKARINRNEQFIEGRVHLLTSVTPADKGYIVNSYPEAKISRYSDDSFSGFVFNCNNTFLKYPVIRRSFNYIFRTRLALERALGGEGEIVSGPIPKRNFFYNLSVIPYQDDVKKGIDILRLYCKWGLEVYDDEGKIYVASKIEGPARQLEANDQIIGVENKKVNSVEDLLESLTIINKPIMRIRLIRDNRIVVKRIYKKFELKIGILNFLQFEGNKIKGLPEFTLIANNPEGKNPLVKEICGALKEDLEKIGIILKIDYLNSKKYYPRLKDGNFDFAFRTMKLTGTPNLYRMFFHEKGSKIINNVNYGRYYNEEINRIALKTKDITNIDKLKKDWHKAHKILHYDPPYLYLWSRRHIIIYNPMIKVMEPGDEYSVPYGYTKINGLINIFNEVHLWIIKDK